jgi:hypothetical protein
MGGKIVGVNADVLRQRYSTMETEALIELQWKEELTELALGVLDEVLNSRGVTDEMLAEITKKLEETTPLSGNKRAARDISRPLKTKWLRVWNYLFLPLSGINNIYVAVTISEISSSILAAIFAIVQLSTAFGLYHRKLWAWRLNWVALLLSYYGGITLPIFLKKAYGVEQTFNQTVLSMILSALIWLWPNYVYWKKRKELFIQQVYLTSP